MTLLSGAGIVGLVTAVAMRQPPLIAVPPGVVAAVACFAARRRLRRQASEVTTAHVDAGRLPSDRSYAIAYPILAFGVLVGLFAAFLVVHETSRTISESAIHAAYWAALGAIWLLPATVQAWQACQPPEGPPARHGARRTGTATSAGVLQGQR